MDVSDARRLKTPGDAKVRPKKLVAERMLAPSRRCRCSEMARSDMPRKAVVSGPHLPFFAKAVTPNSA